MVEIKIQNRMLREPMFWALRKNPSNKKMIFVWILFKWCGQ